MALPKQRVTISDVAKLAGVSEQTVSRTVHDSPSVKPETKERVRKAMGELGYRPNFAGASLRRGAYHTLGIVMYNITSTGNLDRLEGFTRAAEESGYVLTLLKTDPSAPQTLQYAADRMAALPVDGVIFNLNHMADDFLQFHTPQGLDSVIVTMMEHPTISTVDNNQHQGAALATSRLLDLGHRTVHHIAGPLQSLASMQREEGWRRTLAERGIEPPQVLRGDWSPTSGYDAGLKLAEDPSATAVFASNDAMAYGCIKALESRGRHVPDGVSVIGVDNNLDTLVPDFGLTSLRFDNERVGRWAVNKLIRNAPHHGNKEHKLFEGELVERSSVRPAS